MHLTKQQLTGIIGAAMLAFGLFLPIVNVPLMGNRNFFEIGNFNGILNYSLTGFAYGILGLSAASVLLSVLNYCRGLLITASLASGIFILVLKQLNELKNNLHKDVLADFVMNITGTTVDENNLQWGWGVLLTGVIILIITSFLKPTTQAGLE